MSEISVTQFSSVLCDWDTTRCYPALPYSTLPLIETVNFVLSLTRRCSAVFFILQFVSCPFYGCIRVDHLYSSIF